MPESARAMISARVMLGMPASAGDVAGLRSRATAAHASARPPARAARWPPERPAASTRQTSTPGEDRGSAPGGDRGFTLGDDRGYTPDHHGYVEVVSHGCTSTAPAKEWIKML